MKKISKQVLIILSLMSVVFLTACVKQTGYIPTATQSYSLTGIHEIVINGPVAVNVHNGSRVAHMTVYGTLPQLQEVSVEKTGQKVTVNNRFIAREQAAPVLVNIAIPNLRSLEIHHARAAYIDAGKKGYFNLYLQDVHQLDFQGQAVLPVIKLDNSASLMISQPVSVHEIARQGQGNIVLARARGRHISIANGSDGGVYLDGTSLGFDQLSQKGNGEIRIQSTQPIYRINSMYCSDDGIIEIDAPLFRTTKLNIQANDRSQLMFYHLKADTITAQLSGKSILRLSGKVKRLNATLQDSAQLPARNLIANTVYIKAFNQSFARFTVEQDLFANANDQSVIQYLNHPKNKYIQTGKEALVLPLDPPK